MLHELFFRPSLELFGSAVTDHPFVDFVFGEIFRFAFADVFVLYRRTVRIVARHNGAMSFQFRGLKHLPVAACLINRVGYKHRIPVSTRKGPFGAHILTYIRYNAMNALLAAEQFLHLRPARFQQRPGHLAQSGCFGIEPLVDFFHVCRETAPHGGLRSADRESLCPERLHETCSCECTNRMFRQTFFLSVCSSGVPVKPISMTRSPMMRFIASCSIPPCERWHSSMKT